MTLDIDPTKINTDNMPCILVAIIAELQNINTAIANNTQASTIADNAIITRITSIEQTLNDHDKYFWGPIRLSKCHIIPFIRNNKYAMVMLFAIVTFWMSAIDYVVRAAQWALQPPLKFP